MITAILFIIVCPLIAAAIFGGVKSNHTFRIPSAAEECVHDFRRSERKIS